MKFQDRVTNVTANANIWTNGDYHSFAHLAGLSLRFNMTDKVHKHRVQPVSAPSHAN
jgi:hypothetical protein